MPPMQPETVSAFVFCFDPEVELVSIDGFDWFWVKAAAQGVFDAACGNALFDTDNLQVLEVLVPVDVILQGWGATNRFIGAQVSLGPGRGVVGLLRERPAKTDAQS